MINNCHFHLSRTEREKEKGIDAEEKYEREKQNVEAL